MDDPSTDASASPESVESATEDSDSETAEGSGRVRWPWVVVAVAVAAVVATGFLYIQAVGDKDDAIAETATIQGNLDAANDRATDRLTTIADLEDELETTNEMLEASETEQARGVRLLSDTEATLDEAKVELELAAEQVSEMDDLEQAVVDFLSVSIALGVGFRGAEADCLSEGIVADLGAVTTMNAIAVSAALVDGPELESFDAAVLRAADECRLDLEEIGPIGQDLGTGFDYGDNALLDALWDECAAGDGLACDLLFDQSRIGSEYERFGLTCGDRFTEENAPFECEGRI